MTEERKLWEQALAIIDDNLGVQEDFTITNRFATASKIVEFAHNQVKNLTIQGVVFNEAEICTACLKPKRTKPNTLQPLCECDNSEVELCDMEKCPHVIDVPDTDNLFCPKCGSHT